ncbi:hypothetical protein ACHAXA_003755 [Cyclostephanos tholiformis]|uniref:Uncharacterized protein n=1 Tax=Cyclostephanos tholiformis TaxID=382380 RepID=A0ABD3ST09_9STRA
MVRFAFFTPGGGAIRELEESIEVSVDTSNYTFPSCRDEPFTSPTCSESRSCDSEPSNHDDQSISQSYSESNGSERSNHEDQSISQSYSESSGSLRSNHDDTSVQQSYSEASDLQTFSSFSGGSEIDDMIDGFVKKIASIEMTPTQDTCMNTFSTSQTLSEYQEDREVEKSKHSAEEVIVKQESEDENGSADTKTEKEGSEVKGSKVECVVEVHLSESISAMESNDGTENVSSSGLVSTGDKLAVMMRDRIQAINSIRDLLESERKLETDVVFQLSNEVKMLHHDIACKGQANKELMKTVTHLKAKNNDYTQQISQLSLTIDQFVINKNETIQQISMLENDVTAKNIVIDEIAVEVRNKNKLLEERMAQNDDLVEQLRSSKAENDELRAAIQDLVASNKEISKQITTLKDDLAVKTSMVDKMSMEVNEWRTMCEEKATENAAVNERLELSKVESDGLKATIQEFESKNTNYANELENLMSSLQDVVELNGELQLRVEQVSAANDELGEANTMYEEKNAELLELVECLTKSINDERSAHDMEVDEMKKMMDMEKENHAVTVQKFEKNLKEVTDSMNAEMSAQREFSDEMIAKLSKSLKEAKVYSNNASGENIVLKTRMEEMTKSLAEYHEGLVSSISQLEEDLSEEFLITTELKTGTEKLISKLNEEKVNGVHADEVEDLLGNVRMIQSWQVSHIQLINKLVNENKDKVRSIRKV